MSYKISFREYTICGEKVHPDVFIDYLVNENKKLSEENLKLKQEASCQRLRDSYKKSFFAHLKFWE